MLTSFKTAKAEDQLKADEPKPCLHVNPVILKGATMQNANSMQPTAIELFCMKSSTLTLPSTSSRLTGASSAASEQTL